MSFLHITPTISAVQKSAALIQLAVSGPEILLSASIPAYVAPLRREDQMTVTMTNDAGRTRRIKVGFSWAALLLGGLTFFSRGMPVHAIAWTFICAVTLGIAQVFLGFFINRCTARYYLDHGYHPTGAGWEQAGRVWKLGGLLLPDHVDRAYRLIRNRFLSLPRHARSIAYNTCLLIKHSTCLSGSGSDSNGQDKATR